MEEIASERRAGPRAALISAWIASLALVACGQPREASLTGYVEGEYLRVAAPFAGTLQQISVRRGDSVKAGAPLFALERENETAARREAEERLRGAEARFTNLQTGKRPPEVEMIAEQLQQARAARDLSAANLTRQQKLFAQGFISSAALDDVRTAAKRDEARVAELEANVTTTKLPARNDEIRVRFWRKANGDLDNALSPRPLPVSCTTRTTTRVILCRPEAPSSAFCRRPTSRFASMCRSPRWRGCARA